MFAQLPVLASSTGSCGDASEFIEMIMLKNIKRNAVAAALLAVISLCGMGARASAQPVTVVNAHKYDAEWFDAARAGRIDVLHALIAAHYPIDSRTPQGYTALILAAYDGHPEALRYLMGSGANPCAADRSGNTALMGALFKGETGIARTLMRTKCNIDQMNNAGETALSFAALFGRTDLLPELVARGADPNHVDARGSTALQIAIMQGNTTSANALRGVGATR